MLLGNTSLDTGNGILYLPSLVINTDHHPKFSGSA